jgi:LysR family tcuABC transcriptional regulator
MPTRRRAALAGLVTGDLRIGLMPTFTRAVLAPTLEDFVPRHPDVRLHVFEGYSGVLTDMVLADELDFALVPAFEGRVGLRSRLLVRDREMLLSGRKRGLTPLAPVRLAACAPLKIVVPGPTIFGAATSRPISRRTASRSLPCWKWTR